MPRNTTHFAPKALFLNRRGPGSLCLLSKGGGEILFLCHSVPTTIIPPEEETSQKQRSSWGDPSECLLLFVLARKCTHISTPLASLPGSVGCERGTRVPILQLGLQLSSAGSLLCCKSLNLPLVLCVERWRSAIPLPSSHAALFPSLCQASSCWQAKGGGESREQGCWVASLDASALSLKSSAATCCTCAIYWPDAITAGLRQIVWAGVRWMLSIAVSNGQKIFFLSLSARKANKRHLCDSG